MLLSRQKAKYAKEGFCLNTGVSYIFSFISLQFKLKELNLHVKNINDMITTASTENVTLPSWLCNYNIFCEF